MNTDWQEQARCAEIGTDLWFPELGDPGRAAKAICAECPVAAQCLQYAIDNGISDGIWGGVAGRRLAEMRRNAA